MNNCLNYILLNLNEDTSLCNSTNQVKERHLNHKLPVTFYNTINEGIINEQEENDKDEEKHHSSSNATLRKFPIDGLRRKVSYYRSYCTLYVEDNLLLGPCKNEQFYDESLNKLERFPETRSNFAVIASTFISDEHLRKQDSTTSNSMFCNKDMFRRQVETAQKKPMDSSLSTCKSNFIFTTQNNLSDATMFQNISSKRMDPLNFQDNKVSSKASKEIKLNRNVFPTTKYHKKSFSKIGDADFKTSGDLVKVQNSQTSVTSFHRQYSSFNSAYVQASIHTFDFGSSNDNCIDDYNDYLRQYYKPDKIAQTQLRLSTLFFLKVLHKLNNLTRENITPSKSIQTVVAQTNDKALGTSELGNKKYALSKLLQSEGEVAVLNCPVGPTIFESSKQHGGTLNLDTMSLKSDHIFDGNIKVSFDWFQLECSRKQGFLYSISKFPENSPICELPLMENKEIKQIEEVTFETEMFLNKTNAIENHEITVNEKIDLYFSKVVSKYSEEDYSKSLDGSSGYEGSLSDDEVDEFLGEFYDVTNETSEFISQENTVSENLNSNNNSTSNNVEDDYSSIEGSFGGDESLSDMEDFYDCLDISLETSENSSETTSSSTDDDFSEIQCEDAFTESLFQKPVIFSYVDEDTQEMDEILIYPKIYLEKISKNCNKILTREEILPKLIGASKFYDGQPIGIFTHIREARNAVQNKRTCNTCENIIPISTHMGNGEPFLALSIPNLRFHSVEACDQLEPEITVRRSALPIRKSDDSHATIYQQITFKDQSRSLQQYDMESGDITRSSCETNQEALNEAFCECPQTDHSQWNALVDDTRRRLISCFLTIIEKPIHRSSTFSNTNRKQRGAFTMPSTSSMHFANQQEPRLQKFDSHLALQKYDLPTTKQKLKRTIRKNIKVEDIVASDFRSYFCFYAKIGRRFRSGAAICKKNSNYWLKRTGVVVDDITTQMAEQCFSIVAKSKLVLNIYDYVQFLTVYSKWTNVHLFDLIQQLKSVNVSARENMRKTALM